MKSDHLSKGMSEGVEIDPNSPEIIQELLDVTSLIYNILSIIGYIRMGKYIRNC
jgi:hypothetical protein